MRILLTGTTGGIGGATAKAARAAGHTVLALNRADFDAFPLPAFIEAERGRLDALVFATGVSPVKPVALTSDALFEETMRVNCRLFLAVMRAIVAERLYNPAGFRAIAISSVSATEGWCGGAAYCASKGALSAMCRAMDTELRAKKISVRALEPRYVKTKMFEACAGRMGVPDCAAQSPESFAAEILREVEGR